jgi:hypothetical protein
MTSIKPPSGPLTTLPHTPEDVSTGPSTGLDQADAAERVADPQRTVDLSSVTHGTSSSSAALSPSGVEQSLSAASAAGRPVNLVDLARAVESGQLTMGQAVDRLVEGTVGSLPGQLTELERAELSELLRQAVVSDPTLGALRDEQG